jgi:phage protein
MKPKKYPYSGVAKTKKTTKKDKPELVVFPNISLRKDMIKHIFSVVKNKDNTTIIYLRIYKIFGAYEEVKVKVNLSYEETLKILNLEVVE